MSVVEPGEPCFLEQAEDRTHKRVRSVALRYETTAKKSAFCLIDFDLDLTEDVIHHPIIMAPTGDVGELQPLPMSILLSPHLGNSGAYETYI